MLLLKSSTRGARLSCYRDILLDDSCIFDSYCKEEQIGIRSAKCPLVENDDRSISVEARFLPFRKILLDDFYNRIVREQILLLHICTINVQTS